MQLLLLQYKPSTHSTFYGLPVTLKFSKIQATYPSLYGQLLLIKCNKSVDVDNHNGSVQISATSLIGIFWYHIIYMQ